MTLLAFAFTYIIRIYLTLEMEKGYVGYFFGGEGPFV